MQKRHQMNLKKSKKNCLSETLKKIDIIICTALIPGREAPKIIKEKCLKIYKQVQSFMI